MNSDLYDGSPCSVDSSALKFFSDQSLATPISIPIEEFWFYLLKSMFFWLKTQPFYFFSFTVFIVQSVIQFNIYQ